uniref:Uncharacterized protein n=1 Tax=Clandestinovirus TaxID=2831644 RepID=A0A8F8KLF5_9VIRU|nr:hypothetical protein KOM_12_615 [Clandestinovirus]
MTESSLTDGDRIEMLERELYLVKRSLESLRDDHLTLIDIYNGFINSFNQHHASLPSQMANNFRTLTEMVQQYILVLRQYRTPRAPVENQANKSDEPTTSDSAQHNNVKDLITEVDRFMLENSHLDLAKFRSWRELVRCCNRYIPRYFAMRKKKKVPK